MEWHLIGVVSSSLMRSLHVFDQHEWKWIIAFSIIMGLLALLPVIAGYVSSSPEKVFIGFSFVEDTQAYAGYVNSGVQENLLVLQDYSTPEVSEGRYVILYFSLIAAVVRFTSLPLDWVWNAFHFFSVIALFLLIAIFLKRLFPDSPTRTIALILAGLGGGLGGILFVLGKIVPLAARIYSHDLTYDLGYSFIGFSFHALSIFGLIFLLLALNDLLKFYERRKPRYLGWTALFLLVSALNHPPAGVIGFVFVGLFIAIQSLHAYRATKKIELMPFSAIIIPGLLWVGYILWARQDPIYLFHQTIYLTWNRTESVQWYLFGFGFLGLAGAYGWLRARTTFAHARAFELLTCWLFVAFLGSNLLTAGVKYLYLLHFPLAVFAGAGIMRVWNEFISIRFPTISFRGFLAVVLLLLCFSAPFVIAKRSGEVVQQPKHYLSAGENALAQFAETLPPGIVVSDYRMGSLFSWRTTLRPYLAHGFLTIDFKEKRLAVEEFFSRDSPDAQREWLQREGISYVLLGNDERQMIRSATTVDTLPSFNPSLVGLELLFEREGVQLYRVPVVTIK